MKFRTLLSHIQLITHARIVVKHKCAFAENTSDQQLRSLIEFATIKFSAFDPA